MYTISLSKQAQKYLNKCDDKTRSKLKKAIDGLYELQGDIVPLKGYKNLYRLKIPQYRIIFEINKEEVIIKVVQIRPRGDVYKHV